jgi:hypothetical protein
MKPWPFLLIIALALFIAACADPMEQRSGSEVQSQLQRGVTGQGQLGPEQRDPGDPAGEHGIPQTDP